MNTCISITALNILSLWNDPSKKSDFSFNCYWVAIRRTHVFTLQEVEKICQTLQSYVMLVWEESRTASFSKPQVAIFQQIYKEPVTGLIGLISILEQGVIAKGIENRHLCMSASVFLPDKIDFTVMRPKVIGIWNQLQRICKIQQVAGFYQTDYIKGFLVGRALPTIAMIVWPGGYIYMFLSIYLSPYLSIYLPIYLSIFLCLVVTFWPRFHTDCLLPLQLPCQKDQPGYRCFHS